MHVCNDCDNVWFVRACCWHYAKCKPFCPSCCELYKYMPADVPRDTGGRLCAVHAREFTQYGRCYGWVEYGKGGKGKGKGYGKGKTECNGKGENECEGKNGKGDGPSPPPLPVPPPPPSPPAVTWEQMWGPPGLHPQLRCKMWGAPASSNWVQDALPHAGANDNAEPADWNKILGDDRQLLGGAGGNNEGKGDKFWTRRGQRWTKANGNAGHEDEEDAPQRRRATTCDQGTSISGSILERMGVTVVILRGEDNDVDAVDAVSSDHSFHKVEKVKNEE